MPHVSFKCPDRDLATEVLGWPEVPIEQCLQCSRTRIYRDCHYNETLLNLMVEKSDDRISPTRLQACPRQVALKRRYPYCVDPATAYLKVRGTIFHEGLHALSTTGQSELELTRKIESDHEGYDDVYEISGRMDRLDNGLIVDWKTISYMRKDQGPNPRHIPQLSAYAWLLETRLGYMPKLGELIYLDMQKPRRFIVELWDRETTESWIRSRLPGLLGAYQADTVLADVLTADDEDYWMCKSCDVGKFCAELAERGE